MMEQAMLRFLSVWAELEAAYYGKNGYGGNVAEIYAYCLLVLAPGDPTGEERGDVAARELERMLQMFAHVHEDARFGVEVAHREFSPFFPLERQPLPSFSHRIHIQITRGESSS